MSPPREAETPDLDGWVARAAALQGLALDDADLRDVVAFVAVARDMLLKLPEGTESP